MQKLSEVYEKLFHYTTWDGLMGIIKNQTLWATHYKFLNDFTEIVFFRDKLIELLVPHVLEIYKKTIAQSFENEDTINQAGGLKYRAQIDTERFIDTMYRITGNDIYILSFCGQYEDSYINQNGLLSQWRAYGIDGGFALIFDTKKLETIFAKEVTKFSYSSIILSEIIYSNNEKKFKEELSDDISKIAKMVDLLHNNVKEEVFLKEAEKAYAPFMHCISSYKHRGFSEENEVRAVVLPTNIDEGYLELAEKEGIAPQPEKVIKFRRNNDHSIPYIELFDSKDIELPIEKIIVGPHKDKETRAATLRTMFRKTKIEITCSDIPYSY